MTYVAMDSDTFSLGTQMAEYKPKRGRGIIGATIGFLMAVASVFGVVYAFRSATVHSDDRVAIIVLAVFGFLLGWVFIESWIGKRKHSVLVYTDGLVRTQYGKTVTVRWDDVASVSQAITKHYRNGIYTGTTHVYTVQKSDGTKTVYNDALKNVEQLGSTIQDQVTTRRLPEAIALYNSGGTVQLGKLAISPTGLAWGDKSLSWSEIEDVQIQSGYISVKKQGKWLRWANIPVSAIPNLLIALTLIDRIKGLKRN